MPLPPPHGGRGGRTVPFASDPAYGSKAFLEFPEFLSPEGTSGPFRTGSAVRGYSAPGSLFP